MKKRKDGMTCGDCDEFNTKNDWCNKHSKGVRSWFEACDDIDPLQHPKREELADDMQKLCTDCLEEGYSLLNDFKFCPICGKEL